jgi:hypothetical protein
MFEVNEPSPWAGLGGPSPHSTLVALADEVIE